MGLEKVKNRVLDEAKAKAKSRIDEANEQSGKILAIASSKIKQTELDVRNHIKSSKESIQKREDSAAKLESKKLLLNFKKDFIEEAFMEARHKLQNLSSKERSDHIRKLLIKVKREINPETVYCNKKDVTSLEGSHEINIIGGIIAETSDGTVRVDYSYESLLEQLQDSLMADVNKILFEK